MDWQALAPGGDLKTLAPYLLPALLILVILRRNLRPRPLKVERMWFYPGLMLIAAAMLMVSQPPPLQPLALGLIGGALAVGAAIGWQRGRLTHITVDPATHDLTSKASPIGLVLILALFALKLGLRSVPIGKDLPVSAAVLTDASLLFAVGLLVTQRLEMWQRATRLLADARAAKGGESPPGVGPPIVS
jgi:hypothetical protein